MRKYLGWVSIGIIGFTFILFALMRGKVSGYVGTNVLIIGAILALVTALLSKKGKSKTVSIYFLISTHVGPIFSSDTKDCYCLSGLCLFFLN